MKKEERDYMNFFIPDFAKSYQVIDKTLNLLKMYPDIFFDNVKVGAVYGNLKGAIWDGGSRFEYGMVSTDIMKQFINLYNKTHNIPIRLTMTNMVLEKKHLYDTYCNTIMEVFNTGMNEVLVANDLLEEYIRTNYPEYKIVRSTCAAENIPYDDSNKYYMTVLDRRQNKNWELLKTIRNKDKIEFVVNELCYDNCPYMYSHYKRSAQRTLKFQEPEKNYCRKMHEKDFNDILEMFPYYFHNNSEQQIWITKQEIDEIYVPMGFSNFKLVGRSYGTQYTIEGISEYMIKPEFRHDYNILMNGLGYR